MQKLHFVGFTPELDGLILSDRKGSSSGSHVVALDDRLLQVMSDAGRVRSAGGTVQPANDHRSSRGTSRLGSALAPRELQDRLRAGRTVEEVAKEAGTDVAWVTRFAAPVRAEQAQVVGRARELVFDKSRLGPSALPLGPSVRRNLLERGLRLPDDELETLWSAYQLVDGLWVVRLAYTSRGRAQRAEWIVDLAAGRLQARDRLASQLGHVTKARTMPTVAPDTAAVTPVGELGTSRRRRRTAATATTTSSLAGEARPAAEGVATAKRPTRATKAGGTVETKGSTKSAPAPNEATGKKATGKKAAPKKAASTKAAKLPAKQAPPAKRAPAYQAPPAKRAGAKRAAGPTPGTEATTRTKASPLAAEKRSRRPAAVANETAPTSPPARRVSPNPRAARATKAAPAKRASSTKKAPPEEKAPPAPAPGPTPPADLLDPVIQERQSPPPEASPPIEGSVEEVAPPTRVFALPGPAPDDEAIEGVIDDALAAALAPEADDDADEEADEEVHEAGHRTPPPPDDRIFRISSPSTKRPEASAAGRPRTRRASDADDLAVHGPLPPPEPVVVPPHLREALNAPIGEPSVDVSDGGAQLGDSDAWDAEEERPPPVRFRPGSAPADGSPPAWSVDLDDLDPDGLDPDGLDPDGLDPDGLDPDGTETLAALYPPPAAPGAAERKRRRLRRRRG